jgi:hypothetical protein
MQKHIPKPGITSDLNVANTEVTKLSIDASQL